MWLLLLFELKIFNRIEIKSLCYLKQKLNKFNHPHKHCVDFYSGCNNSASHGGKLTPKNGKNFSNLFLFYIFHKTPREQTNHHRQYGRKSRKIERKKPTTIFPHYKKNPRSKAQKKRSKEKNLLSVSNFSLSFFSSPSIDVNVLIDWNAFFFPQIPFPPFFPLTSLCCGFFPGGIDCSRVCTSQEVENLSGGERLVCFILCCITFNCFLAWLKYCWKKVILNF